MTTCGKLAVSTVQIIGLAALGVVAPKHTQWLVQIPVRVDTNTWCALLEAGKIVRGLSSP